MQSTESFSIAWPGWDPSSSHCALLSQVHGNDHPRKDTSQFPIWNREPLVMQAHSSSKFSIELFQVVSRNGLKTFTWSSSKVFLGKAEARKKICWRAFRARRIKESQRFFLGIVTGFLSYLHCMSFIHTVVVISSKEFLSEPIFVIVWNAVLCKKHQQINISPDPCSSHPSPPSRSLNRAEVPWPDALQC